MTRLSLTLIRRIRMAAAVAGLLSLSSVSRSYALPPEVAGEGKFVVIDLHGFVIQDGHDIQLTSGAQTIGPSNHYNFDITGTMHGTGRFATVFPAGTNFAAAVEQISPGKGSGLRGASFESVFGDTYDLVNETISGSAGPVSISGRIESGVTGGVASFALKNFSFTVFGFHDTADTVVLDDAHLLGVTADRVRGDFNVDAEPDLLVLDKKHKLNVGYLHLTSFLNKTEKKSVVPAAGGAKLPSGFSVAGVSDFNLDGNQDILLFNPKTSQTEAILMNLTAAKNGTLENSILPGPTLPSGFSVAGIGDFNLDGSFDLLIANSGGQTKVIFLKKNMELLGADLASSTQDGPTLPTGFQPAGAGDFNDDGMADILLFNPKTRQTEVMFLNGLAQISVKAGPVAPKGFVLVGASAFDNNRSLDLLLFNKANGQTKFFLMDGATFTASPAKPVKGPTLTVGSQVVGPR